MSSVDVGKFGRVAVLMGGASSERAISLKSGEAIFKSLDQQGYDVCAIDLVSDEEKEVRAKLRVEEIDIVFIALHGQYGEDGNVQRILTDMGLPYTGSQEDSSRRAFDKSTTQNILKKAGMLVPDYVSVTKDSQIRFEDLLQQLQTSQVVVKPVCEGSSMGVHLVQNQEELDNALSDALIYGPNAMIETYIKGRELTVGILDEQALPVIEIQSKHAFFDYTAKYQTGMTEYVVPASLTKTQTEEIQAIALKVNALLGCRHLGRVDFILQDHMFYCLEMNTIPGFTPTSLLPKAAQHVGISFEQLTSKILESAYAEKKENKTTVKHT